MRPSLSAVLRSSHHQLVAGNGKASDEMSQFTCLYVCCCAIITEIRSRLIELRRAHPTGQRVNEPPNSQPAPWQAYDFGLQCLLSIMPSNIQLLNWALEDAHFVVRAAVNLIEIRRADHQHRRLGCEMCWHDGIDITNLLRCRC